MALDMYIEVEGRNKPLWVAIEEHWHSMIFSRTTHYEQYRQLRRLQDYYADCTFNASEAYQLVDDIVTLCDRNAINDEALLLLKQVVSGSPIVRIWTLCD